VSDPKLSERMYGRARDRDLERAAERFADTVHADVSAQVRLAWALERDRLYAEIAELRAWQADHDKYAGGSHDAASPLYAEIAEIAELRDKVHATARKLATLIEGMHARGYVLDYSRLYSVRAEP